MQLVLPEWTTERESILQTLVRIARQRAVGVRTLCPQPVVLKHDHAIAAKRIRAGASDDVDDPA